ncbi:MAG: ClpXP protease specificity-enhancing factor [Dokdonella sp.]
MTGIGAKTTAMTSNRPYLMRALYDWISDNDLTPYLLVDANFPGIKVPKGIAKDGRIVLNTAARAVSHLQIGKEAISFSARFGGVSHSLYVPLTAVLAIYAQENGQGMMFPAEDAPPEPPEPEKAAVEEAPKRAKLRVVK